jgi:hypothetical protein
MKPGELINHCIACFKQYSPNKVSLESWILLLPGCLSLAGRRVV